jgi:apolipoprotein D and lipocalin family protein
MRTPRQGARLAAIALGVGLVATLGGCRSTHPPLDVVDEVDLDRYLGRWYEIASFPQRFQRGCVASMATYTQRDDGRIGVVNECRDRSFDGELRRADGVAWVADEAGSRAKLKVQFFWPFRGDYWIIALDATICGFSLEPRRWIRCSTGRLRPGSRPRDTISPACA